MSRESPTAAGGAEKDRTLATSGRPHDAVRVSRFHPARLIALGLILVGLGILVYPFLPLIRYELFRPEPSYPYATRLLNQEPGGTGSSGRLPNVSTRIPTTNRLVIPKIGVDMPIVEGPDERTLYRGSWRIPDSSTPPQGGNTVLTVHRFQYLAGPNTLALADRLTPDDTIIVYWKSPDGTMREYDYRIDRTYLVTPDHTEILENTAAPKLTVFTCAPMFSTKQRLILDAVPIEPPNS